jgi:hypothetical protein
MNGTFLVALGNTPPFTHVLANCPATSDRFEMTRR